MPPWVIRKTLPVYDHGLGLRSTPALLYWAGPNNRHLQTSSWVWISGPCPQVASFPTRAAAEAAAQALAGPYWHTPDLDAVNLHRLTSLVAPRSGDPASSTDLISDEHQTVVR